MKAVVAAFNQEKALVGAFSVITNLRMELFEALILTDHFLDILWTLHLLAAKWIMDNPGLKVVPAAAPVPV